MAKELSCLLNQNPGLTYDTGSNKVVCSYNGHEMPHKIEAVRSFISGKKYQKLKDKHTCQLLEQYKQHIVPSSKRQTQTQLFCKLTLRHLNHLSHHIERHVNGKRFKKALARWQACKEQGVPFKPRQSRTQKDSESGDSVKSSNSLLGKLHLDGSEGTQEFEDDLDDLYPPEDFHSGETDEESDLDLENMETDVGGHTNQTSDIGSKTGEKRKAKEKLPETVDVKKPKISKKGKTKKHKIKSKEKT